MLANLKKACVRRWLRYVRDSEWNESEHPRAENGQFASAGGGEGESQSESLEDLFALLWNGEEEEEKSPKEPEEPLDENGLRESDYPEDIRLAKGENERLARILEANDVPDRFRDKDYYRKNRDLYIEEQQGAAGYLQAGMVNQRIENAKQKLKEAEQMIQQRKDEGYKGKKRSWSEWNALKQELTGMTEHERGDLLSAVAVGEKGIQHWQSQRKNALQDIEHLEFAKKLQARHDFAKQKKGR